MCDQVVSLVSSSQTKEIVWREGDDMDIDVDIIDGDDDHADRLYTFEVSKTNEQEESVTVRQGFQVSVHVIHTHFSLLI